MGACSVRLAWPVAPVAPVAPIEPACVIEGTIYPLATVCYTVADTECVMRRQP